MPKEPTIMQHDCFQLMVDSVISETGQSVRSFVVRELRPELGPVPTLLLLTVVQIVKEKRLKLKLAKPTIVQVKVDAIFFSVFIICALLIQSSEQSSSAVCRNKNARISIVRFQGQIVLSESGKYHIKAIKRIFFNRV